MAYLIERTAQLSQIIERTVFSMDEGEVSSEEAYGYIHELLNQIKIDQKKVFVIGNGGSAGIAAHHVVDLINVLNVPALTLSDTNLITCMGNDYGYETIYARPLTTLANKGDLLIAISSSGQSENILKAVETVKRNEGTVITLSGFDKDNPLRKSGHLNIWTPEADYGLVESAHFLLLHTLVDGAKYFLNLTQRLEKKKKVLI